LKSYNTASGVILTLLILAGCASAPKTPEFSFEGPLPLDSGALVYLVADVPLARPFLDLFSIGGLRKEETAQVLDRTRYAAAAVFPPDSGRRFQAVAWGAYPSFGARLALTGDWGWKRGRAAAGSFWYSAERDAALAFNRAQAFAVLGTAESGTAPASGPYAQGPGIDAPEGFNAFREGAPFGLWMENPVMFLDRFFSALRLPIRIPAEELLAALSMVPGADSPAPNAGPAAGPGGAGPLYEIRMRIKAPSETSARTLMTLFSTARLFISGQGGAGTGISELLPLLFARLPEQEGPYLTLRTAPMRERDVALLFSLFLVYSGQN
jgi:hypothetical protein